MSYYSTATSDSGFTQQHKKQPNSGASRIAFISFLFLVYTFVIITFVIVIRLYIRRTIRRYPDPRRGPSIIILSAVAPRPQSAQHERGLEPAALAAIPRFPYARRPDAGPAECAVCLSEVEEGEVVRDLPGCGHLFHVDCIDMWLHSHTTCPVCRAEAEPKRPVAADVEAAVAPTPNPCGEASENQMSGLGSLRGMFGGESARALPWDDLERQ